MLERLLRDVDREVAAVLDAALDGRELSAHQAARLLRAEGAALFALLRAADVARAEDRGDDVSFVICRNINFTNVCYVGCSFCGFSRHREDVDAYDHSVESVLEKARDAVQRGATEVCIQGGIHPAKDHRHYREILVAIKSAFPELHIHAFSPEEIDFGQRKSGMALRDYLAWLRDAGLGTIPGTAAEILDDQVRKIVSPKKLGSARWVEIVETAHA
ncbi:MAG: radical SAM protein, partial [Myxococcales bacterium]|nr:radical SAM protein [Myxococcales bacterium]